MKINSLLLAVLAAFANAQDAVDPADAQGAVHSCGTEMDSMDECLTEDVDRSCKNCVEVKYNEEKANQPEVAGEIALEVLATIVDECEAQDDWCGTCASELDAYLQCLETQELASHSGATH
mmetsp:Transcript_21527/g.46046  ORF Transcript_21527/g.46046 Transcript_21527/m.46046 type:complete len:121 (+) Transcript_21527:67-429(+)